MHILFALPGLHQVHRGAEVALENVADAIARNGVHEVTVIGSGVDIPGRAYRFRRVPAISRRRFERWPKLPFLRTEYMYEDLTFATNLFLSQGITADISVTCSFPYTSWALRRIRGARQRARHVFVTQNGDWPASETGSEAAFFSCDGLICTNPLYFERNQKRWFSSLIPNGVDPSCFAPGQGRREALNLPTDRQIVLMVSALEDGKRVLEAVRAVSSISGVYLVIAGDGALREEVDALAAELMPGRLIRRTFSREQMPHLYRSADVFLHTAIEESFGNVYIEALSCNVPIIANDDSVTRWIFGDKALLVDARSQRALYDSLHKVLLGQWRPSETNSQLALSRYSWSNVASRYTNFLESVSQRPI